MKAATQASRKTGGAASQGQGSAQNGQKVGGAKKNPLDVTEMFETFMKMK